MTPPADGDVAERPRDVLIVEDSPVIRRFLTDILESDPRLRVAAAVRDGIEALDYLKGHTVDVVTLDVHMPNLGGLETLKEVVRLHRLPCVMVSSATQAEARVTLDALDAGAVDFFAKPEGDNPGAIMEHAELLREKVLAAASSDLEAIFRERPELVAPRFTGVPRRDLVLLGASTGGPRALSTVLACFPGDVPHAFLVAQHMPARYTTELSARLDASCQLRVREAEEGDALEPGTVLVAPGGRVTVLVPGDGGPRIHLRPPQPGMRSLPSVNALFQSAAKVCPERVVACLLTGMGNDGTAGMAALRAAGGVNLAESERSSVVFGMPGSAIAADVVDAVVSKEVMAEEILHQSALR